MKYFKEYLNEAKQIGIIYHLLTLEKLLFVLKNNKLESWNFYAGISTTRNKNLNNYVGSGVALFFKLELDGDKLTEKFKISPFSYTSSTGVSFQEYEEIIKTTKIDNIWKYVNKLIIIKDNIENDLRFELGDSFQEKLFNRGSQRTDFGRYKIADFLKELNTKVSVPIYFQEKNVLKKFTQLEDLY